MITLMIAAWRLRLICQPDALAAYIAARYAPFVTDDASPHFTVALALNGIDLTGSTATNTADELQWRLEGAVWRLKATDFNGHIIPQDRSAAFAFRTPSAVRNIDLVLKTVFAVIADLNEGLLLHASGLLVDEQAFLFMGHGGSGKTTVTQLSSHALALNDDTVLVHRIGGRWTASGTPFWNHETIERGGQTASGVLKGIYRLAQDRKVWLEPFSLTTAMAELLANCPVVNGDPDRLPGLLARCRQLAADVPVQRLHFCKDSTFWGLLLDQKP